MKGQSAMEFLMTYSWAILAIIFVISVIVFTGYFSVGKYQMNECRIHPDLPCLMPVSAYDTAGGGYLGVKTNITNGMGFNITINSISTREIDHGYVSDSIASPALPLALQPGQSFKFEAKFGAAPTGGVLTGQFLTYFVNINYTDELGVRHVASGRIRAKVE